jgi:hypothetical protein
VSKDALFNKEKEPIRTLARCHVGLRFLSPSPSPFSNFDRRHTRRQKIIHYSLIEPKQTLLIEYLLYGQAMARQVENNCVVAWIEEAEDMAR